MVEATNGPRCIPKTTIYANNAPTSNPPSRGLVLIFQKYRHVNATALILTPSPMAYTTTSIILSNVKFSIIDCCARHLHSRHLKLGLLYPSLWPCDSNHQDGAAWNPMLPEAEG